MPRTAFFDLWNTVQSGKIWQGYVKNNGQHGRYYWVKATVFPCYRDGTLVGFLSVRVKASKREIDNAIEAYRKLP